MGVRVDESRRDNLAVCLDGPLGFAGDLAYCRDTPILDGDITAIGRVARAINNEGAFDDDIVSPICISTCNLTQ
jgi:hypothetical protein